MKRLVPLALVAALAMQPACFGSYSAFRSVHRWNSHATANPVANSAIHFGLWILPLYPLCLLGDFFVFNTVEFFTNESVFK